LAIFQTGIFAESKAGIQRQSAELMRKEF